MGAWLSRVWNDEEAFKALCRRLYAVGLTAAGIIVPQLVDLGKGGWWVSLLAPVIGLSIPTKPIAPKA